MDTANTNTSSAVVTTPPPLTADYTTSTATTPTTKFDHNATNISSVVAEFHIQGDIKGESQQELVNRFLVEVSEREERGAMVDDYNDGMRELLEQHGGAGGASSPPSPPSSQPLLPSSQHNDDKEEYEEHTPIPSPQTTTVESTLDPDVANSNSIDQLSATNVENDVATTTTTTPHYDDMPATISSKQGDTDQVTATHDVEVPVTAHEDLHPPVDQMPAATTTTATHDIVITVTPDVVDDVTTTTPDNSTPIIQVVVESTDQVATVENTPPPQPHTEVHHHQDTQSSSSPVIPVIHVDAAPSHDDEEVPIVAADDEEPTTSSIQVDTGDVVPGEVNPTTTTVVVETSTTVSSEPCQIVVTHEAEEEDEQGDIPTPTPTANTSINEATTNASIDQDTDRPVNEVPTTTIEASTTLETVVALQEETVVESPPRDYDDDADFYVERDDEDGGAVAATPLDTAVLTTTTQIDIIRDSGAGIDEITSPRGIYGIVEVGDSIDDDRNVSEDDEELMLVTEASEVEGLAGSPVIDLAEGGVPPLPTSSSSALDVYESPGGRFQRQDAAVKRATFGDSASDVDQTSPNTRGPSATRQMDYEDSERGTSQVPDAHPDDNNLLINALLTPEEVEVIEESLIVPLGPTTPCCEEVVVVDTVTPITAVEDIGVTNAAVQDGGNGDHTPDATASPRDADSASPEPIPLAPPESDTSSRRVSETVLDDSQANQEATSHHPTVQLHTSTQHHHESDGGDVTPNGDLNLTSTLRQQPTNQSSSRSDDGISSPTPHRKADTEQVSQASTPTDPHPPATLPPTLPLPTTTTTTTVASEWDNKYFHISPINDIHTNTQGGGASDATGNAAVSDRPLSPSYTVRVTRAEPFIGMRSQRLSSPIRRTTSSIVDSGVGAGGGTHYGAVTFTSNPQQDSRGGSGSPPSTHTAAPFQPWVPPKIVVRPITSSTIPSGAVTASSADRAASVRSPERGSRSSPDQYAAQPPPTPPTTNSKRSPPRQRQVGPPGQVVASEAMPPSHPPRRTTSAPRTRTPTSRPSTPQRSLDIVATAISIGEMPPELCLRTRPSRGGVGVYPSALQPQELGRILGFMLERKGRDPAATATYAQQLRHNKSASVAPPPPSSSSLLLSRTSSGTVGRTFVSIHSNNTTSQYTPQNSYTQQHSSDATMLVTPTSSYTPPPPSGIHNVSRGGVQRSGGAGTNNSSRKASAHISSSGGNARMASETVDRSVLAALVAKQLQRRL